MSDVVRILTVCTGNICRSPYIERRLQRELDKAWQPGEVEVRSAGTGALVDERMDPSALALLTGRGGDGEDFRARALTKDIVAGADLVITATRQHRTLVSRMHPRAMSRTHALLDLAHVADDIGTEALPERTTAREWFDAVVPLLAARRGLRVPLEDAAADVVDPYRQAPGVFERMQTQVEDALPHVLRVLGA